MKQAINNDGWINGINRAEKITCDDGVMGYEKQK